jgi:hypothetical protein
LSNLGARIFVDGYMEMKAKGLIFCITKNRKEKNK